MSTCSPDGASEGESRQDLPSEFWSFLSAFPGSLRLILNQLPRKPGDYLFAAPPITIEFDDVPVYSAFHPDGQRLFVTSSTGERVWVISTSSGQITGTIPLGTAAGRPFFSEDGSILVIATGRGIAVVDTSTFTVRRFSLAGPIAAGVAIFGDRIYVAQGRHGLSRVDLSTGRIEAVPGLICPYYPVADRKRGRLYVACRCGGPGGRPGHDTVDILDLKTERSIGSTLSGPPMVGDYIVPTPSFDHLWLNGADACVAPFYDHLGCPVTPGSIVHLYRTSDGAFVKTFGWPYWIHQIAPHPDGKRVILATEKNGGTIQVLNTSGFHSTEELPVPGVAGAALSSDGRSIAAVLAQKHKLLLFRPVGNSCEPPEEGLASFWSGDGTFDDAIRYTLLPSGDIGFSSGILGSAFRFGPTPGSLAWKAGFGPAPPDETGTLAAWVNPDSVDHPMTLVDFKFPDQLARWSLRIQAGGQLQLHSTGLNLLSKSTMSAQRWTHVALVKTKERLGLFVNGQLEASELHTSGIPLGGFLVGTDRETKHFFRGLVDEIVRYDRALAPAEVKGLYDLPYKETCTGLSQ